MTRAAGYVVMLAVLCAGGTAGAQCVCDADNDNMVEINELVQGVNNSLGGCQGNGETGLFFGARTTSATTAELIGYFQKLDASDLVDVTGTVTLGANGTTLNVSPDAVPFQIEQCDFVQYQAPLTSVVGSSVTDRCPINFSDDNSQEGTVDCFYTGRWNQSCGDDNLQARWISDLANNDQEIDVVIIDFVQFFGSQAQAVSRLPQVNPAAFARLRGADSKRVLKANFDRK
jgi:hypothetical protein